MDAQAATELLASVRAGMGDAARTRALVAALAPSVRATVSRTLAGRSASLARSHLSLDDAVQDVLTKLLEGRLPTRDGQRPDHLLEAWVRTLAMNWFRDAVRRPGHRHAVRLSALGEAGEEASDLVGPKVHDPIERAELRATVDACAEQLSALRRKLFEALVADPDASLVELAAALGYAVVDGRLDTHTRDALYTLRAGMRRDMAECLDRSASRSVAQIRRAPPSEGA